MALSAGEVFVVLGGRFNPSGFNSFGAATRKAGADMRRFEQQSVLASSRTAAAARGMGRVLGTSAKVGVLGLTAAVAASVKTAADFEKSMHNVNSIAGLTAKQMAHVRTEVLAMSKQTAQSPKVLADGLYQIYSSGIKGVGALKVLHASAVAASAGLTDTSTSATAIVGALNAYRLPASQAAHVSDILFQTVNRGVISFEQLAQSIGPVYPIAARMGVPLKEVGAAISTLTKEGIPAAEATTYLKNAITAFAHPSEGMKKAVDQLGASSAESLVKTNGLEGALSKLIGTTDGSATSIHKLFPELRASQAVLGLTGNNARAAADDLHHFNDQFTKNAARNVFNEQMKSTSNQLKQLKDDVQVAAIQFGSKLLPYAQKALAGLNTSLQDIDFSGLGDKAIVVGTEAVGVFQDIRSAATPTVGVIEDVAGAMLRFADLGDATHVEAILGGLLAFKAAAFLAPLLMEIGAGITFVATAAATAPTVAAFGADLLALVNPVTAIAAVVATAAAALILLSGSERTDADATKDLTAAKQDLKGALDSLNGNEIGVAEATRRRISASQNEAAIQKQLNKLRSSGKGDSKQAKDLQEQLKDAHLATVRAQQSETDSLKTLTENRSKATTAAEKELHASKERVALARANVAKAAFGGDDDKIAKAQADAAARQNEYNAALENAIRVNQRVVVSEANVARERNGLNAITSENQRGVSALFTVLNKLPKNVKTRLQLDDQGALSKLGRLTQQFAQIGKTEIAAKVVTNADSAQSATKGLSAILDGVPDRKVVSILAKTGNSKQEIRQLNAEIQRVHDKQVTVNANADQAVAALRRVQGTKIENKVSKVLASTGDAQSKFRQLIALKIPEKQARAIAEVSSALGGLSSVRAAIAAIPASKTVTLTTNIIRNTKQYTTIETRRGHASGRPGGLGERALVGEGAGPEAIVDPRTATMRLVTGPQLADLKPSEYVIPYEDRFRGRALGLMQSLAHDMGIAGYKKGKKGAPPKKSAANTRYHPPQVNPISLPVESIDANRTTALKKLNDAKALADKIPDDQKRIKDISGRSAKTAATKAKKARDLAAAHKTLAEHKKAQDDIKHLRADYAQRNRELAQAKKYQAQIDKQIALADIASTEMVGADGRDDQAAYDKATKRRGDALAALAGLLQDAQKVVRPDSPYARELEKQLAQNVVDVQDLAASQMDTPAQEAAQRLSDTGMTDAERATLAQNDADTALAALTQPLDDDQAAARRRVDFLTGVLSAVQGDPARGGASAIADVATQLKQARDNLSSLTGGSALNGDSDLQAQLDQANLRASNAQREAQLNATYLAEFQGSGDINGRGGVVVHQTINTLHPGSPQVALAVGNAAAAGFGYQNPRSSSRQRIGPA